jgi:hypothetical protein
MNDHMPKPVVSSHFSCVAFTIMGTTSGMQHWSSDRHVDKVACGKSGVGPDRYVSEYRVRRFHNRYVVILNCLLRSLLCIIFPIHGQVEIVTLARFRIWCTVCD